MQSKLDVVYQAIRISALAGLIYLSSQSPEIMAYSQYLPFVVGYIIYSTLMSIFVYIMQARGFEQLNHGDSFFIQEDSSSYSNIQGSFFFEKFEYESMKKYLEQKTGGMHRCRSKLEKFFGLWWFKEMEAEEWNSKKHLLVQRLDNLHTDKDLCKFMAQTAQIREAYDTVQYRFWLIPDFSKERSVIIVKAHHSMGDGLSLTTMFMQMCDKYNPDSLPGLKPVNLPTLIITNLIAPILALRSGIKILFVPWPNSILMNKKPLTGKKAIAFCKDVDLAGMKRYCKAKKCTINDYATSLILTSIHEYCHTYNRDGFEIPEVVYYTFPFSTRAPVKDLSEIKMKNETHGIGLAVPLKKEMDQQLPVFKSIIKSAITWLEHVIQLQAYKFNMIILPSFIGRYLVQEVTRLNTFLFSNLNASKTAYNWDGKESTDVMYSAGGTGQCCNIFTMLTINGKTSFTYTTDHKVTTNPQQFVDILVRKNKENIATIKE